MKINLHIERIVIEGDTLTRRQREQLAATLEAELAHQLRQAAQAGGDLPSMTNGWSEAGPGASLSSHIARQVLAALPLDTLVGRSPVRVAPSGAPPVGVAPGTPPVISGASR
jgi:hypothetical protein